MKKRMFDKVVIVGAGFMGGSLGRSIIKNKLAREVVAVGRKKERLLAAKRKKAADKITTSLKQGVEDADLVIISVPVNQIPLIFMKIREYLPKKAVVTDMGSVKGSVAGKINKIDSRKVFVGSHPMVGSEKSGIVNMREGLFKGGTCIVTQGKDKAKTLKIIKFWKSLGMNTVVMKPGEHDECVAVLSHVPHLLAFLTVDFAAKQLKRNGRVAGTGFKDFSRIAASNENVWAEIFAANKTEMIKGIRRIQKGLLAAEKMIAFNKIADMKKIIKHARKARESLK